MTSSRTHPATEPDPSVELRLEFLPALVRRDVRVSGWVDLTPGYRRIRLTGPDLADGFPMADFAPGDHVKVYFPDPETGVLVSYRRVAADPDAWELDGDGDPIRRDYTPRSWDAATGELSLDFVLHDHGVAGRWARRVQRGDRLVIIGPRAHWLLPRNYPHYVALGDETAIPGISRMLAEAPATATVTAVIEVADAGEEQPLGGTPDRQVHWVHRDTATVADGHLSVLETAVAHLALPDDLDGLFVFGAGEATAMRPIRRWFRRSLGLPKHRVLIDGYWRRGTGDFDHHTIADED